MNSFSLIFGYFDWLVLALLISINYFKWNSFHVLKAGIFLVTLLILFGFSLPIVSMFLELKINSNNSGEISNLFYTYYKFPVYWVIGIIQIAIIYFRGKKVS